MGNHENTPFHGWTDQRGVIHLRSDCYRQRLGCSTVQYLLGAYIGPCRWTACENDVLDMHFVPHNFSDRYGDVTMSGINPFG